MAEVGHDRGTFGELMARLVKAGKITLNFSCRLDADPDSEGRWYVWMPDEHWYVAASGRTGEEALRRLVEKVEAAHIAKTPELA